jgi:hypothetical protein
MTAAHSSAAKAGPVPNKPWSGARLAYSATVVQTPKRDADLFGAQTIRIDGRPITGGEPFPVLYLSAYHADPAAFAGRVVAALAWVDDTQAESGRAMAANDTAPVYSLPQFVEDVDFDEVLFLAEELAETDWKAWAGAMVRRVNLATTDGQIRRLMSANATGATVCPRREMGGLARALSDAYLITQDQAASA